MQLRSIFLPVAIVAFVGLASSGCVPFFDTEPTGELVAFTPNACGGLGDLSFDGTSAEPGESCGVCAGEGHLACNGVDALRCVGAREPNACGGCVPLEADPFDECGVCDVGESYYVCDGPDALECIHEAGYTACGGCSPLEGEPGQPCDAEDPTATWTCVNADEVVCTAGGPNLCGGEPDLEFGGIVSPAPGMACDGACAPAGVLRCAGPEEVVCEGAGDVNVCGGCGPVQGELEAPCGRCGRYICNDGSMFCVDQEPNRCGGCDDLPATPGDACDGGTIVCNGDEAVICVPQSNETNACGGLGELSAAPGDLCGTCDSGLWVCDGTSSVVCEGDLGDAARNGCGGCEPLPASESDECGECGSGRFACDPNNDNRLICEGDQGSAAHNDCGGCAFLWGTPGQLCGECYLWECPEVERDSVICAWAGERPEGCPDSSDCTACEATFRECLDDGCGECIEGYIEEDTVCVENTLECDDHGDCPDGDPGLTGICSRLNPDTCSVAGQGPGSFEAGVCLEDGTCDAETVAVDVDCVADIVGEPCAWGDGLVGICTADEECVLPNVVYTVSGPSRDGSVTSPPCPVGFSLSSGGCLDDGANPFYSSGPTGLRPDDASGHLSFEESWTCNRSEDSSDDAVHYATGVCVRDDILENRWFTGAVTGSVFSEGMSPTCEDGTVIGGGCIAGRTLTLAQDRPILEGDSDGEWEAPEGGQWTCRASDVGELSVGAMCAQLSTGRITYALSRPSTGFDAEVGCETGILIGGGCRADDGRDLTDSHPFPLTGGDRRWRCSATITGRRTVRAIAICLNP